MYAAQIRELKSLIAAYEGQNLRELDDKISDLKLQLRQTEELAFRRQS